MTKSQLIFGLERVLIRLTSRRGAACMLLQSHNCSNPERERDDVIALDCEIDAVKHALNHFGELGEGNGAAAIQSAEKQSNPAALATRL